MLRIVRRANDAGFGATTRQPGQFSLTQPNSNWITPEHRGENYLDPLCCSPRTRCCTTFPRERALHAFHKGISHGTHAALLMTLSRPRLPGIMGVCSHHPCSFNVGSESGAIAPEFERVVPSFTSAFKLCFHKSLHVNAWI